MDGSLSELTPIVFNTELIHLDSDASISSLLHSSRSDRVKMASIAVVVIYQMTLADE